MEVGTILRDILVVLIAAQVAAELSPRLGIPTVVGEILAGFLVGPSLLGVVDPTVVLDVLAELGVILLLVEVGMQMDLADLRAVGGSALSVAVLGVAAPLVGGFAVMSALGADFGIALFLGAALTATSVGITARVFTELRMVATVEARTVLGAAVADDVIGLLALTVVGAIVAGAGLSATGMAATIALAGGFLIVAVGAGLRFAPWLFEVIGRITRTEGALVALSLAFVLLVAQLAGVAGLAPVIGAFVAGLVLARHPRRHRIRSELVPVGHLLVPVFFLQIGINVRLQALFKTEVVVAAAALLAVAVAGKVLSGLAASRGDRLLIGLGMLPRGEVGLIFAGLGLREGILDDTGYGSLVLVVLLTTLMAPALLRWRASTISSRKRGGEPSSVEKVGTGEPRGLVLEGGVLELGSPPHPGVALETAFEAALAVSRSAMPGDRLLAWLGREVPSFSWNRSAATAFLEVLMRGNERSWRFLDVTGVLERALPELAESLRLRQADPSELDPEAAFRWRLIERLQAGAEDKGLGAELAQLARPDRLYLAALVQETAGGGPEGVRLARRLVQRLDLGAAAEQQVVRLLGEGPLLKAAAARSQAFEEETVLQLAVHFGSAEPARASYVMALAAGHLDEWERARLDELHRLVQSALANVELTDRGARNLVERKRARALQQSRDDQWVSARVNTAPWRHVLAQEPARLVQQAHLIEGLYNGAGKTCSLQAVAEDRWVIELVSSDRLEAFADATGVLLQAGVNVEQAAAVVWDRARVLSFIVKGSAASLPDDLEQAMRSAATHPLQSSPMTDAEVGFDNEASPWHTLCDIAAPDRRGLLHAIAVAAAASGVAVRAALVRTESGRAVDHLEIVDRRGNKLNARSQEELTRLLRSGTKQRKRSRSHLSFRLRPTAPVRGVHYPDFRNP